MNSSKLNKATRVAAIAAAASLTACASITPDAGFNSVQTIAQDRLKKDLQWNRAEAADETVNQRIVSLLAKPLTADDAVQLALLNNRGLQASFSELAIAQANLVQASRLPNPHFGMLRARDGSEYKIEQMLTFNIFSLLTLPQAKAFEQRRFEQTKVAVAQEVMQLASQTRKAYYSAVAADETVRYMLQVRQVADSSAELARRMAQVGNFNKLAQAREHSFYADAALNLARASQQQSMARERLIRLLGLWGNYGGNQVAAEQASGLKLPERLPDLPQMPGDLPNAERTALAQRLDVQAAKLDVEATAKNLGLTKTTRFINALEFGPARVLEGHKTDPYKRGYEVSFELPIFDWGDARVAKAEAIYMQSVNMAAQTAINARSEVRESYQAYRINYDIAKHYRDEVVPIRKRIADENLLRYNGMIIGVFELLADARSQISSVNSYIESLRDFWLAQSDLDMAMIGRPSMGSGQSTNMKSGGDAAAGH